MLGLRFCARAFSSCGKRGPLFIAVRGPLTITASLAEHRLQTRRLSTNFTILAGKLILLLLLTDLDLEVKTHQLLQSPLTLPCPFSLPVPTPPSCRPLWVLILLFCSSTPLCIYWAAISIYSFK